MTLGVGEPFTTTIAVALYFALILALPVVLYRARRLRAARVEPRERRAAAPLLIAVPFLFVAGVMFGYFVVLPAAVRFLVNFNSSEFNVLVQASQFYSFAGTVLLAMGLVFQVPILIVGACRLGLVDAAPASPPPALRDRRVRGCRAVLPGDVVTLALETVPLYLLYEASILVAVLVGRAGSGAAGEGSASDQENRHPATDPAQPADQPTEPTVQRPHRPCRPEALGLMCSTSEDADAAGPSA